MKHRRLTSVSLFGAPAAMLLFVPAGVFFLCAGICCYVRFLPAQEPLPLPAGAGNHSYFTL